MKVEYQKGCGYCTLFDGSFIERGVCGSMHLKALETLLGIAAPTSM